MGNQRSALLLGASGLVGGHSLRMLLNDPVYERVTVLLRRSLPFNHDKLTERLVQFDQLRRHSDLFAVDDIYCCLGTTIRTAGSQEAFRKVDFEYPLEAARLGTAAGARQLLIVTALGANPHSRTFYSRVKGEIEEAVRGAGYPSLSIFRPSLLLGDRKEFRLLEVLSGSVMRLLGLVMVGVMRKYRPIEAEVVARAMVRVGCIGEGGVRIWESDQIQEIGGLLP